MKILITGNLGFVGGVTEKLLISQKHEVIGYDLMAGRDIRDREQLFSLIESLRPDRILHLAAMSRFQDCDRDPELAFETNVLGSKNLAEVAFKFHIPLVYSSTGSIYMPITKEPPITEEFQGRGNSVYGCTKYMGELYVRKHTPHIVLRYAHLYGNEKRGHGLVGAFVERIERGIAPELYGGKQSNDFTYIEDVAYANLLSLTASWDKWNQVYNIGSGEELTAEEAGRAVCEIMGYKGEMKVIEARNVDPQRFIFDISKARRMLGYEPKYNFRAGLQKMMEGKK